MASKILNVVYASDDNFAEMLGVSLLSLYDNNREMEKINVFVFDNNISRINKEKVEDICKQYNRTLVKWIQDKDITKILNIDVNTDRGSASQYARLFVSSVLPINIHRVLYLDCDTIINQSLAELWNLDLRGNIVAALLDAFSKYYRANIGLRKNDVMFNSGVMLIDLDKWRENKVEEKLLEFIKNKNGVVQQGDQGALNAVLTHSCLNLEPRFNSVTIFYDFTYEEILIYRKPPKYYTKEEIMHGKDNPIIIHYTSSFLSYRPWVKDCKHIYKNKWIEYKNISPWKNYPLQENPRLPLWKNIGKAIFKIFPRKMAIIMASVPQAYIRPIKYKIEIMVQEKWQKHEKKF